MIWELAQDLVTAMQDRLLELYATAQKKKQAVEEKARAVSAESSVSNSDEAGRAPQTAPSRAAVRTGGGVLGDVQRPLTADVDERLAKKLPASRMPGWAVGKGGADRVGSVGESVASLPGGKWAARVDPTKDFASADRNKLTLEMTVEEATWRPPQSPTIQSPASRRVDDMENSDDVLIDGDKDDIGTVLSSSDDESPAVDVENGDDILNRTSQNLDELENAAVRLEGWLEKKVRSVG